MPLHCVSEHFPTQPYLTKFVAADQILVSISSNNTIFAILSTNPSWILVIVNQELKINYKNE